jgi:hypothetical protein
MKAMIMVFSMILLFAVSAVSAAEKDSLPVIKSYENPIISDTVITVMWYDIKCYSVSAVSTFKNIALARKVAIAAAKEKIVEYICRGQSDSVATYEIEHFTGTYSMVLKDGKRVGTRFTIYVPVDPNF